jgi:DNA polymerase III alpha subunit
LATAIDSLYGAWLKVNYPLEYYTTVFGYYEGDMERTNKLTEELNYFGIKLKSVEFGYSSGQYQIDRESNSIYKGIGSIKYCNAEIGNQLYELRNENFSSFVDFLNVSPLNSRQLTILIKLGFFKRFGGSQKLLRIAELYDAYHGKKILKKEKCLLPTELIEKHVASETEKQYRFTPEGMDALLAELCEQIPNRDIPLQTRLQSELEYLGYISYCDPSRPNTAVVMDVNCKYTPKLQLYRLDMGTTITAKLQKKKYESNPLPVGAIINFKLETKPAWKKDENGGWIQDFSRTDTWVSSYTINSYN